MIDGDINVHRFFLVGSGDQVNRAIDGRQENLIDVFTFAIRLEQISEQTAGNGLAFSDFDECTVCIEHTRLGQTIPLKTSNTKGRILKQRVMIAFWWTRAGHRCQAVLRRGSGNGRRKHDGTGNRFRAFAAPCGRRLKLGFNTIARTEIKIEPERLIGPFVTAEQFHCLLTENILDLDVTEIIRQAEKLSQPGVHIGDLTIRAGDVKAERRFFNEERAGIRGAKRFVHASETAETPERAAMVQRRHRDFELNRNVFRPNRNSWQNFVAGLSGFGGAGEAIDRR